ncbi:MAG: glycosyltransferase family 2 protein [Bryobacteraceae bacterium]
MTSPLIHVMTSDTDISQRCAISVIVTCYFEEKSLREFHGRLKAALESLGRSYEIVIINDGSTDGTWPLIQEIFHEDENVVAALDFAKNSGQGAAITAGLNETTGARIVLLDSDLQLSPEELPKLVEIYDRGPYDLVTGYREQREDSWSRKLPSLLANVIMRRASNSNLRDFGCTFKVYNGDVLRAGYGPHKMFQNTEVIARLARYTEVPVSHAARRYGKSGWTFTKLYRANMDNFVSMSDRPFQFVAVACLLIALLFIIRVVVAFFTTVQILPQITPGLLLNAIVIAFLIETAVLCAVGEFSIRNFNLSRRLPLYIIRERWRRHNGIPVRVLPQASRISL